MHLALHGFHGVHVFRLLWWGYAGLAGHRWRVMDRASGDALSGTFKCVWIGTYLVAGRGSLGGEGGGL